MQSLSENLASEVKSKLRIEDEFRADGASLVPQGKDLICNCPFHNENTSSCIVHPEEQFFKCFGCGASGDVLNYLTYVKFKAKTVQAREFVEVMREACLRAGIEFPESKPQVAKATEKAKQVFQTLEKIKECCKFQAESNGETITQWNENRNPDTDAVEYVSIRFESKTVKRTNGKPKKRFLQVSPVDGGYIFGVPKDKKTPIFNRKRIRDANTVVIVEGEKCMKLLHEIGIAATTAIGGGQRPANMTDWLPLAGKEVILWPDGEGLDFMKSVADELKGVNSIAFVPIEEFKLGKNEDAVDLYERTQGTKEDKSAAVIEAIANAQRFVSGAFGELRQQISDELAGLRYNVPFPWRELSKLTQALIPGSVFVLVGGPGSTKSFNLVQCLRYWLAIQIKAVALMCEDGKAYHLERAIAQEFGCGWFTNIEEKKNRPSDTLRIMADCEEFARQFDPYLEAPSDENSLTCEELIAWVLQKAIEGFRVICIDPVTAMEKGNFGFNDDRRFMLTIKKIATKYKCSIFLVTHLKDTKYGQRLSMADLAGGKAYERFSQCVALLTCMEGTVTPPGEYGEVAYNRDIEIFKARNGVGRGKHIASFFEGESVTMREIGIHKPKEIEQT